MKMGKRNGKRKKKRNSQLAGPRGDFGPASTGACSRAGDSAGPRRSSAARADAVGAGPRVSERSGVNGVERATEGG